MFCYQCEQTAGGKACTKKGVCGKEPVAADLQDLLTHVATGVSMYAHRARELGAPADHEIDRYVIEALFTTVTNVSFDADRIEAKIREGLEVRDRARAMYESAVGAADEPVEKLNGPAELQIRNGRQELLTIAAGIGFERAIAALGDTVAGLKSLVLFGLRGAAAYTDHAMLLGVVDDQHLGFYHEMLNLLSRDDLTVDDLLPAALKVGEGNLRAMELLDSANTGIYGHPEPTQVRVTPVAGKAILVSGHDLKDLATLLEQTKGKGINVYTHGEMLPAHGYPELKKHPHLVGNYGGAWQEQRKEFDVFPGAVLMTTNCIQKPKETYGGRIFTTGLVSWPGVRHVEGPDFTPVIDAALKAPGFSADEPKKSITVGFGRNAVLSAAPAVIDAVKGGKIRHFFLIGGCDGAKPGRNYYTELAQKVPDDCVIMTLACGKYRFNKLDFGTVAGLPRLLDVGQCNDSYSAVQIALALADAFETDVNSLPLSLVLSWYEQKAVAILLSLLHLGIKNIRLGPSLPAFITPQVLDVLVRNYGIAPISTPDEDLTKILGAAA